MFFRRIVQHLRKQEWTAIGIDFVIVVLGVFVATQVSEWNTARLERAEYRRAVERLETEIAANLEFIDSSMPEITTALDSANRALDALLSCADSAENTAAVNAGFEAIRGTYTIPLRRRALTDLATNPTLLAQQSDAERQHFADLLDYLLLFEQEMRFSETHPLAQRVEDNPLIQVGPGREVSFTYGGVEYVRRGRFMILAVPVSRACHDDRLVKSFFTWTRWQSNLPMMGGRAREQLAATQTFLAER
jgi:hypothetical protein